MTTQLTDSLGATWTYHREFDQWETDDDGNETEWEGCDSSSTLDMADFLEYIVEDLKAEFLSQTRSLGQQPDPQELPRLCAQLRSQLLGLRAN